MKPLEEVARDSAATQQKLEDMLSEKKTFKKLRDIPGPTAIPFFGTTLSSSGFGGKDLMQSNEEQVRKYGPLVKQEHYWNHPIVEIFDPDDIEKVLRTDKSGLIRPPIDILNTYRKMRKDRYSSTGIVNAVGEQWLHLKGRLTKPLMSPKAVVQCIPRVNETGDDFITLMRTSGPFISEFDDLIQRVVSENSCQLTLGRRMGLLTGEDNEKVSLFMHTHKKYWCALHNSYYGFPLWKFFPNKIWRDFVDSEDSMYTLAEELTRESLKENYNEGLLSVFLGAEDVDYFDKITAVMDFIIAAIEPVVNSLTFILYWIAKFDDVQEKLQAELRQVLPRKDSPIDAETLKQMPYLKACLREAFRFTPTAPNLARILETDIQLQGYNIPAYTVLICQTWYNAMLEKNFYRAKEFLPERWLNFHTDTGAEKFWPHRESVCTHFGCGKRMCPGKRYAFQELCIIVAKVFRNFRLEYPDEIEYKYEFLLTPTKPIRVNIIELPDDM